MNVINVYPLNKPSDGAPIDNEMLHQFTANSLTPRASFRRRDDHIYGDILTAAPASSLQQITLSHDDPEETVDNERRELIQQWECVVLEINDDVVGCQISDLTEPITDPEYAEVFWWCFRPGDRGRVRVGSVFYWSLGDLTTDGVKVGAFAEIRLRPQMPLPRYKHNQIQRRASRLTAIFQKADTA